MGEVFAIMYIIEFGDEETADRLKVAVNKIDEHNYKSFENEEWTDFGVEGEDTFKDDKQKAVAAYIGDGYYREFNEDTRSFAKGEIDFDAYHWKALLFLLKRAILDTNGNTTVAWRGIARMRFNNPQVGDHVTLDTCFSSFSRRDHIANYFRNDGIDRRKHMYNDGSAGVKIKLLQNYASKKSSIYVADVTEPIYNEDEVLFLPWVRMEITNVYYKNQNGEKTDDENTPYQYIELKCIDDDMYDTWKEYFYDQLTNFSSQPTKVPASTVLTCVTFTVAGFLLGWYGNQFSQLRT